MKSMRSKPAPSGFTLIEMLVVVVIIAILVGLLLPVLALARRRAKEAATSAEIKNLEDALTHYRTDWQGSYPVIQLPTTTDPTTKVTTISINPIPDQSVFDTGDGLFNPCFFQVPCAAQCSPNPDPGDYEAIVLVNDYPISEWKTGDNGPLMRRLINNSYLKVNQNVFINDRLVDYFNSPIIVRFLIIPSLSLLADGSTSDLKLTVTPFIWSYGYNKNNDTNAQEVYFSATCTNNGLNGLKANSLSSDNLTSGQVYDYQESQNLLNSVPGLSDAGEDGTDDDVIGWQQAM